MSSVDINMLHSLKPFQCPKCNLAYSSRDAARHNVTRFPRILTCCHSACENCLHSAKKFTFSCPTCEEKVDLSEESDGLSKFLPDVHALGILSVNMKNSLPSLKLKMGTPAGFNKSQNQESLKKSASSIKCGHCYRNDALWQCDECQLNFCSLCFGDVHSDMKSKRKHEAKKIFSELYNSMVQEGCSKHENKAVEFYCEADDELTCSYCMLIGDHVGHEVKTLLDKNKSCAAALNDVLDDVTKMQRQLKYTDHQLCNVIPKEKVDTSHLMKEVHDHFHKLHALLQIREAQLISELTEISESKIKPLEDMRLKVTGFERDLAAGKKDAEAVINNPCLAISAPVLLKKLQNSKDLPCHIVPVTDNDSKYITIDLDLNSDLEDQIKQFGKVKCNIKPKFELKSSSELPITFHPSAIPEDFDAKTLDTESCATSVDNFSEDSLSTGGSFSSMQATLKCKDFTKMQPEKVSVTHIKSPSSFFVQRFSDSRKIQTMSDAINKYCRNPEGKKNKPSEIIPGDLYLVKYSMDNLWYRGRVKKMIDPDDNCNGQISFGKKSLCVTEGGKMVVRNREVKVEVFYIDFGNTEIVSIHNFKNILPRFLNAPSLARECSLVDINPATGVEWSEEVTKTFAKLVGTKAVIMLVYEERNNLLYVDLCQVADNDISCDTPVSVRDALVFLEYAVFPSGLTNMSTAKRNKNLRSYMPPESLRVNANIWTIVSHVEDPYSFYVQQMSTASYLSNLIFEMNETYNKDTNPMLHSIYVPYVGMICAAQFSLDKQWYRAKIIGLPGGAKVEVQYVDFGNKEVIHHKRLRKLFDRFLKLNIQAIPCKLAHVSYNQEKCWSTKAKEWLTNEVSRKHLTVKSLSSIPGSNTAEVVLYYSDEQFDICVNSLMVQKQLATSTGPFGSAEVRVKKEVSAEEAIIAATSTLSKEVIPPPILANEDCASSPACPPTLANANSPLKNTLHSQTPPKKYPTLAPQMPEGCAGSVDVYVSHIENPGCFYIRFPGDEKKLNSLMQEMQKTYENLEGEIIDCSVGKSCAVYSKTLKKWHRGTVLSKLSDDRVKIHFVDYGRAEEVQKKDLRKLLENFTKDAAFSLLCHLDGIIPAGGSAQWPQTACDAFRRAVEPCETLRLSIKGESDPEKNSVPADLLIENLIIGGALEPTKLEFQSVSATLVTHGLALPLRKKSGLPSGLQVAKTAESERENLSWANRVEIKESENKVEAKEDECNIKPEIKEPSQPETCNPSSPPPVISSPKHVVISSPKPVVISSPEPVISSPQPPVAPKFQWKPSVPPVESSFSAYISNIGDDGSIHIYVLKEGSSQVDIIKKALQFKFARGNYEPLKVPPPIGEACIAKFELDNMWYRAEVLSVYPGKVKVNFVDYGNNEIVSLTDIRPEIIMQTFPRQCIECTLFGLENKMKWDNDLTTFLHSQLVDNTVTVHVKGPFENEKLPCQIKMSSGMDVAELLLSMGFGGDDLDDLNDLSASQGELDIFKSFTTPKELREGDMFPICVTLVPSPNIVYLQKLMFQDPKDDYEREHNEQHESFLQLIAELNKKADSFPKLQEPLPGMPCCAKYKFDENWYRCEVTDLTEDGAVVLYVDYGNSATVSADDLKVLESSFIDLPVQVYFCELHGMKPIESDWNPVVREMLDKKLLGTEQKLIAKVVVPGNISQIDILSEIDGEYKLVYKDIAESNLIILDK